MASEIVLLGKWYPRFDGGCRRLRLFGEIARIRFGAVTFISMFGHFVPDGILCLPQPMVRWKGPSDS